MKYIFALLIALTTSSCFFGPVKELKYQIEDSFDEGESLTEPKKFQIFHRLNHLKSFGSHK